MPNSLPFLWALLIISIAVIGAQYWLATHDFADLGLRLPPLNPLAHNDKHDLYEDDFDYPAGDDEPTFQDGPDAYKSDISTSTRPPCNNCSSAPMKSSKTIATAMFIADPPYENYFYSDSEVAAQVVVTSPTPEVDLSVITPRFIVAWPAGNSGACLFFSPENGINGTLAIKTINSTIGSPLAPVHIASEGLSSVGVQGVIHFNSSAILSVSILGSIRAIRDFTEGPSLLHPKIQEGNHIEKFGSRGVSVSYLWLDNVTTTTVTFSPGRASKVRIDGQKVLFEAGHYLFSAHYNFPQLNQLSIVDVLKDASLIKAQQHESKALSFLTYSDKMLAGAWRFLTYFGRDDMISALVLLPVLTGDAVEAVIGSVLERVNRTDGSACHEETIGDYATYLNLQDGVSSTAYRCDYSMVDTEYFLPILMQSYFGEFGAGLERLEALLSTPAGKFDPDNKGLTWGDLFILLAEKIITATAPFAQPGGQTRENLIHLRDGHETGVWRDSVYGLGGGRIPFDVNVALAPAALRSIASLAKKFGYSTVKHHAQEWSVLADQYAQVWEDHTLEFFKVVLPAETARERLETFVKTSTFYNGPSHADLIDSDISYNALALEGNNGIDMVPVMNSDSCCRIFFLNGTNQARLTNYLNATALSILRPFPAGLMTPLGLIVANPAFSENEAVGQNFTNSAYHGAVVWSWQLVMMVRGLEKQMDRCNLVDARPEFCDEEVVYSNVKNAYNSLWDVIEANKQYLSDEVWTWVFKDGKFRHAALGSLPPPPGVGGVAESDIVQLWSLTFLAVKRNEGMRT